MAISPVSSVSFRSYNNINFEGRKKKEHNKGHIYVPLSHKLTVPLAATVLAMSPMSSQAAKKIDAANDKNRIELVEDNNDDGKLIDQKIFFDKSGDSGEFTCIKLTNSQGGSSTFDKIIYDYTLPISNFVSSDGNLLNIKKPIKSFNDVTYELISDDGSKGSSFHIKSVDIEGYDKPKYLAADQIEYIEKALNSTKNKSNIQVNKLTRGLRHNQLEMQNVPNGDILKNAVPKKSYGKLAGSQVVELESGKYKIGYYSTDDNMDDAEIVTLKKDNYPELWVRSVKIYNAEINSDSDNPAKLRYGVVTLEGDDRTYCLCDDMLTSVLIQIFSDDAIKNATEKTTLCEITGAKYITTSKGELIPLTDVKN